MEKKKLKQLNVKENMKINSIKNKAIEKWKGLLGMKEDNYIQHDIKPIIFSEYGTRRSSNINDFRYKVITKDEYIQYRLNEMKAINIDKNTVDTILDNWNKTRGKYNFIIAAGKYESLMFYSIEYFNEHVLGRG